MSILHHLQINCYKFKNIVVQLSDQTLFRLGFLFPIDTGGLISVTSPFRFYCRTADRTEGHPSCSYIGRNSIVYILGNRKLHLTFRLYARLSGRPLSHKKCSRVLNPQILIDGLVVSSSFCHSLFRWNVKISGGCKRSAGVPCSAHSIHYTVNVQTIWVCAVGWAGCGRVRLLFSANPLSHHTQRPRLEYGGSLWMKGNP